MKPIRVIEEPSQVLRTDHRQYSPTSMFQPTKVLYRNVSATDISTCTQKYSSYERHVLGYAISSHFEIRETIVIPRCVFRYKPTVPAF
jgi:hypothetical protein